MRRALSNGYELDDDPARIDRDAVYRYLAADSYWARGRPKDVMEGLLDGAARVVGLYHDGSQVGFARVVSDGYLLAYLADVYVLEPHRRRGLGVELVRFTVEEGPHASLRWLLQTEDAHGLYERFGFGPPSERWLERRPAGPRE
jgi:GNAT superfamily N-acetyltransferase